MRLSTMFLMLVVGCESVESSDIRTSGIWADMTVSATGDGTSTVETWLRVGGPGSNTYVDLVDGDSLSVAVGEIAEPLDRVGFGDLIRYQAIVETDSPSEPFVISLERPSDESAPDSSLSLPSAFGFESVSAAVDSGSVLEGAVSGVEPIDGETLSVVVDGDCVFRHEETVDLSPEGVFRLTAGAVQPTDPDDATTCTLDVSVIRSAAGSIDPALEGGTAQGRQLRSLESAYTPLE